MRTEEEKIKNISFLYILKTAVTKTWLLSGMHCKKQNLKSGLVEVDLKAKPPMTYTPDTQH